MEQSQDRNSESRPKEEGKTSPPFSPDGCVENNEYTPELGIDLSSSFAVVHFWNTETLLNSESGCEVLPTDNGNQTFPYDHLWWKLMVYRLAVCLTKMQFDTSDHATKYVGVPFS